MGICGLCFFMTAYEERMNVRAPLLPAPSWLRWMRSSLSPCVNAYLLIRDPESWYEMTTNAIGRIAPEVNRALFVKNLPFNVDAHDLYDLFGRFGAIRQVRLGHANDTKGTCYVVYEEVGDAKTACEKLSGFNFKGRYLTVLFHSVDKLLQSQMDMKARREALEQVKKANGID